MPETGAPNPKPNRIGGACKYLEPGLCLLLPRVSEACAITLLSSFFPPVPSSFLPLLSEARPMRFEAVPDSLVFCTFDDTKYDCVLHHTTSDVLLGVPRCNTGKARNKPASTPPPFSVLTLPFHYAQRVLRAQQTDYPAHAKQSKGRKTQEGTSCPPWLRARVRSSDARSL